MTIHGATWAEGKIGGALSFDGDGDYVSIPAGEDSIYDFGASGFTLAAWFKTDSTSSGTIIGTPGNGEEPGDYYRLDVLGTGQVQFEYATFDVQTMTSPSAYNDNKWHLAVAVRDDVRTGKLYIDGDLVAEDSDNTGKYNSVEVNTDLYVGQYKPGTSCFNGIIDDVRIYNYALSQGEITAIYTGKKLAGRRNWMPVLIILLVVVTIAILTASRKKRRPD